MSERMRKGAFLRFSIFTDRQPAVVVHTGKREQKRERKRAREKMSFI